MNGFLIAAPQSGSGKTTVALAIMAAFRRRSLKVAPFKCGPDFIDPGYHRLASGKASINLDAWICSPSFVRDTFTVHSSGADVAVIEGVMGLFDGLGSSRNGSSAEIAQLAGAPVVLVVNARGMAASAAAVVKGFAEFDEQVQIAGVIFNNVGSVAHGEMLRQAIAGSLPEIAVFGCIVRDDSLAIPSRYLGLVTVEDNPLSGEYLNQLADMAERSLDLDRLAGLGLNHWSSWESEEQGWSNNAFLDGAPVKTRIAVARDAAFCFVYEDNLRLLRKAGAEIIEFSPLADPCLPENISGIYLPGGYPELYGARLASNLAMLQSLRHAAESGMTIYAECGGFIYLTEGMEASGETTVADFVGVFPVRASMLPKRKALGYRQAELAGTTFLGNPGTVLRGHEFHYSEITTMPQNVERCYRVSHNGKELGMEGYRVKNCLGSYLHLHWGSNPAAAEAFVQACKARNQL